MNRESYDTSWWQKTDKVGPYRRGFASPIFQNLATGEEREKQNLPVGALYAAKMDELATGHDGWTIVCRLPEGHNWNIDSRASNCTMPTDTVHRCWVRHGTIGDKLTVDKSGVTCRAGAGSINVDGIWHGFLKNGRLVSC